MTLVYAFLVSGFFCLISQIVLDNFKITPGHATALFTVVGSILSFFGIYEKLIKLSGAGATVLISNFGHMLYQGAMEGYKNEGALGLFTGMLSKSSAAITSAIIFAFVLSLIFKPKD
ncbi:MAG: SpoVA/SpoVAEb family sporulation membrane protein [Firmicutes bacterium]|nr:SpoVA/SpoVAEb family sporulation membrane protein [Bacillota bacterium]